jgi:hypothetical protein
MSDDKPDTTTMSDIPSDLDTAAIRIVIEMARERGVRSGQFYRYTPAQIMALVPTLSETRALWDEWSPTGSRHLDAHPTIRRGYVIRGD